MSIRRIAVLTLALALACVKGVQHEATPASVDYAVFDPNTGEIPLPNDLAYQSALTLPAGAQKDLLLAFAAQNGFPNDMEVPISVDFTRKPVDGGARTAVGLKPESVNAGTVLLLKISATGAVPVAYETAGITQSGTKTTLRLRAPRAADGSRNWEAGAQYVLAVRGGAQGVKTADDQEINPMPVMFLLLSGKPLDEPENQALLPDPSLGAQLETLRTNYLPAFMLVDRVFPSRELAVLSTFKITPAKEPGTESSTYVRVDSTAGVVPLPFDLLRTDADGTIINNPGFGPAAHGIDTLDGFSTTAMMLAPTSGPIDAATVNAGTVLLYKLPATGDGVLVNDVVGALSSTHPERAVYVTEPSAITQPCGIASGRCATAIGLQPAVPAPTGTAAGTLWLPPLDEATEYAVVITKGVKDVAGQALKRSTIAKILLGVTHPVAVGGVSQLAGVDDATATMMQHMRDQLARVWGQLPSGTSQADVAMAYTFKTQSVTGTALRLSALPYGVEQASAAAVFTPSAAPVLNTATFGIPAAAFPAVDAFYAVTTKTLDAIDPTTGALRADLATASPASLLKDIQALVAVPKAANVTTACPAPHDQLRCAKLVIFHHGLGGGHLQMLQFANALAAKGFVVAAIDFPLHGDRAPCSTAADCNPGGSCNAIAGAAGQGDQHPPGVCSNGNLLNTSLTSVASGRYFISANFFRTRDAFRQNLIDQSALALAISRPPAPLAPQPAANPLATALLGSGIVVDPSAVYWEGISLGGIAGAEVLATNPRVTRGTLSVPGGTLTDVFTNSPTFAPAVDQLFLSLGIDRSKLSDPAVAAKYLQTLVVAKWILDPADPINFASHVRKSPLPNLLSGTAGTLQDPKDAWVQIAQGDLVIPNPFNFLLANDAALPSTVYTHNGGDAPHSMLAASATCQANAADWLFALTNPGASVNLTDF